MSRFVVLLATLLLPAAEVRDPRSHELLRVNCVTGSIRSDLTLFANGTFRLREGEVGAETMHLSELDPDSRDAFIRRLQAESLGDTVRPFGSLGGIWTESCRLSVDVPDGPAGEVEYGNLERHSLELSRVIRIAEELVTIARAGTRVSGIPDHYQPRRDEILIRRDGARFRVRGLTSDGLGIVLEGLDQPLTLYVALVGLGDQFIGIESSDR